MKKQILFLLVGCIAMAGYSQSNEKDSIAMAAAKADSIKMEKAIKKRMEMFAKVAEIAIFPVIEAGTFSGVVPVEGVTEIPNPNLDYKLLFELVEFDDEDPSKVDASLTEVARIINLHVASGIPVEKIFPVLVVHAGSLNAFTTNTFYNEKFKMDNPNLKLIGELEDLGAKFISCGQAMFFFEVDKEALLPMFKVSLTAQTVMSSYQMQGYVKFRINTK
ncbi:DsrE family protein [Allomuricauda sp. M10]|uniref:DsrE family protein n=1 Tax=Allomuricauda sp. M10 TaxID=2683292 RepID=UPI001D18B7CB|nr:DsrE family protein [Muricauda sp. M10]